MFLDFTFITHVGLRCTCPCCWLDKKTVPRYPKAQVQVSDIPNVLKLAHDLLGPDVADITTAVASHGSRALDLFYLIYALLYYIDFFSVTFCTLAFLSITWFFPYFLSFLNMPWKRGTVSYDMSSFRQRRLVATACVTWAAINTAHLAQGIRLAPSSTGRCSTCGIYDHAVGIPWLQSFFWGAVICFSRMLLYDYLTL